jgi:hypothetical protein
MNKLETTTVKYIIDDQIYIDAYSIRELHNISKATLHRMLKWSNIDYIEYKNQKLYREDSINELVHDNK